MLLEFKEDHGRSTIPLETYCQKCMERHAYPNEEIWAKRKSIEWCDHCNNKGIVLTENGRTLVKFIEQHIVVEANLK